MKKINFFNRFGMVALLTCAAFFTTTFTVSCSDDDDIVAVETDESVDIGTLNPMAYISDDEKVAMLRSMKDLDGTGRIYEINYTEDYDLDDAIEANMTNTGDLLTFVQNELFDIQPTKPTGAKMSFLPSCSAFAVPETGTSNFLMGRNYDFSHAIRNTEGVKTGYKDIAAFVVRTAPKDGYKSISFVDGLQFGFERNFHKDKNKDISMLVGLPYCLLDGINEKGFAIGVLALNEAPTWQNDPGKKNIICTVAMRLLLDKAATVDEAIALLKQYNMRMTNTDLKHNYHYFMADATGNYAIVEYTRDPKNTSERFPTRLEIFNGNDTMRCVTNFYVAPIMAGTTDGWGSDHGKWRYDSLRNALAVKKYSLTSDEAMGLLNTVSQPPTDDITSQTQWSTVFNLSQRSLRVALLRDYAREFKFSVK